jgi:hypothetical protein
MADQASTPIRSFRVCFKLERRIHKIDRWRIPLAFGVPLRGLCYAVAILLALLIAGRLPLLGGIAGGMPSPLRFVLLPIGGAYLLMQWEIDGRSAHATGVAWLRLRLAPARLVGFRSAPPTGLVQFGELAIAYDDRGARMRPAVVDGPATVVLRYPFAAQPRGRTLKVVGHDGEPQWRGKQVRLADGQRMVIR